ncbi:hypothetical protein Dsin_023785 [Dipteronia sinensis]|uniref:Rubber elongation factor protein n=1 Tax=Dipteronia sinensis TaxID=43782 RepID=A0AAE0A405_9ROSI|nr:hypothetical protein Dsin_023785 [Dipteronia sinensis]
MLLLLTIYTLFRLRFKITIHEKKHFSNFTEKNFFFFFTTTFRSIMAEEVKHSQTDIIGTEEEESLKRLEFVQVATLNALVCFSNLYGYAKERSGPLMPGVDTMEGTVKSVVGPVYKKFQDVPIELLKYVDRKVDESVTKLDRNVPPVLKQVPSQALSAAQMAPVVAQSVVSEMKRAGVVETASGIAKSVYTECEPTAKGLYTKYEPKAEQCAVSAWKKLNQLPLVPRVAQSGCANCRVLHGEVQPNCV